MNDQSRYQSYTNTNSSYSNGYNNASRGTSEWRPYTPTAGTAPSNSYGSQERFSFFNQTHFNSPTGALEFFMDPRTSPYLQYPNDWSEMAEIASVVSTKAERASFAGQLFMYSVLKYFIVLVNTPFSNVVLLKQIQYTPSSPQNLHQIPSPSIDSNSEDTAHEDLEDEDVREDDDDHETDNLFGDTLDMELQETRIYSDSITMPSDASGYLIQTTFHESDPTRPSYQLSNVDSKSSFGVIYTLIDHNDEGLTSLWKGHSCRFTRDMIFSWLQPSVELLLSGALQSPLFTSDIVSRPLHKTTSSNPTSSYQSFLLGGSDEIYLQFLLKTTSHVIPSMILNPLDLVQARLVAQTSRKSHRKYRSTMDALTTILREEYPSSPFGLWTSSRLWFPSLLYHSLTSVFKIAPQLLFEPLLGGDPEELPLSFILWEFGFSVAEMIVMIPIETIRNRLFCQVKLKKASRNKRDFESVVQLSPIPYSSTLDAALRIMGEEGISSAEVKRRKKARQAKQQSGAEGKKQSNRRKRRSTWGLAGLYRGFRERLVTTCAVTLLNLLTAVMEAPSFDVTNEL